MGSATQEGQLAYLKELKEGVASVELKLSFIGSQLGFLQIVKHFGREGSHWDNATLFDNNNKATLGMQFYKLALIP